MSEPLSVYATPVPTSVTRLMDALDFPHAVSCETLAALDFASLLDVGAGKDPRLAEHVVRQRGARYTALDFGRESGAGGAVSFAEAMRARFRALGLDALAVEGDVRDIPPSVAPADVVHQRFVFMHLTHGDRRRAFAEMRRLARRHVALLDYSWRTVASASHPALVAGFVERTYELMALVHADPFAGEALRPLVREVAPEAPCRERVFALPEGDHADQLFVLCPLQADIARGVGRPDLAAAFEATEAELRAVRARGDAFRMTSAAIHAVVVDVGRLRA
jgi:hypothetical protein